MRRCLAPFAGILGCLLLLLLAGAPAPAGAAPRLRARLVSAWTDNLFQSYSERGDWIQLLSFDLDVGDAGLAGYYAGDVQVYGEYSDLFTQTHTVGLGTTRYGDNRRLWTADLSASVRAARTQYDYRDYRQLEARTTLRRYLRPTLMLRAGAGLRLRDYRNAGDFSYLEPSTWVQLSRFLPTRTTLVAGLDLGVKGYLQQAAGDSAGGAYGRTANDDLQALGTAWLKVAQNLAPRTGLQLQLTHRRLALGAGRFQPETYDPVNELFDDGYSYGGTELRATLKSQGLAGFDLRLSAHRARRDYEGRPALDLTGAALDSGAARSDRRLGAYLRLERDLGRLAPLGAVGLRLEASATGIDSNDPYYDTAVRVLSMSVDLGL